MGNALNAKITVDTEPAKSAILPLIGLLRPVLDFGIEMPSAYR